MPKGIKHFKRINGADFASVEGIIAITRALAKQYPNEPRIKSFLAWVDKLGRVPTNAEFETKVREMGFRIEK